jgi:beta-galactosidase
MTTPITYGVDYYPEQWTPDRWETDLALMREAGIRAVRLAEFAWGLFEPREGVFEWQWLDEVMGLLEKYGMRAVLCTPTPTPPAWLTHQYPEALRVNEQGARMHPGARRHICANNPDYRRLALRITEKIAERYGQNERVIAWQTDNEFGCHDTIRCLCEHCQRTFQEWLREKYQTLDALNQAWGTNFWSQRYTEWAQIQPPRPAPAGHNPGLVLDFYRFSSDTWVKFNAAQTEILRRHAPSHALTHNLMIYFFHFDHYQLAKSLDFVSWDNYHHFGAHPVTIAANHDLIWGAKEKNFWVIEQQVGQVNWTRHNPQFPPGMLMLKTLQAVAHGADGILFFRWRQARYGAEMYHSGLLDHAARPTRAYDEASALGSEWDELMAQLGGQAPAHQAAILFDFASHWALDFQPHTEILDFRASSDEELLFVGDAPLQPMNRFGLYFLPYYEALWHNNIQAAIISPEGDLSRYKVIFAPQLHIATDAIASRLQAWVEQGGTLVIGPRTGFKLEENSLPPIPQPAALTSLIGGTVLEFDTRENGEYFTLDFGDIYVPAGVWAELWEPEEGTEVLATYADTDRFFDGYPAVIRKAHGAGQVITLGAFGGWKLIDHLLPTLGIEPSLITPYNVEAVQRGNLLFLLNHNPDPQKVTLPSRLPDYETGDSLGVVELDGYGYKILMLEQTQTSIGY